MFSLQQVRPTTSCVGLLQPTLLLLRNGPAWLGLQAWLEPAFTARGALPARRQQMGIDHKAYF